MSIVLKPWPERILGPCPTLVEWNRLCWILFGSILVPLFFVLWVNLKSGAPSDFVYFYGIGRLINTRSVAELYNYSLQLKVFNEVIPLNNGSYGPSPYPPFVALLFSLAARVPFRVAFLLWMGISLTLYSAGLAALLKEILPGDWVEKSIKSCFALAFPPFLIDTLSNGQIASVAFCSICLAISQSLKGRRFLSGLALSFLAYKPTLLLLLIPVLLLTRRFRVLLGFLTGTVAFCLAATAVMGVRVWPAYFHFLSLFRGMATSGQYLHRWQFVDLNSLSYAVTRTPMLRFLILSPAVAIVAWLFKLIWISDSGQRPTQYLVWATTLTWTLLLNIYVPGYDSILVVISILLTLSAVRDLCWSEAERWISCLAILIFAVAWVTKPIAQAYGIQPLTISLLILGCAQAYLLRETAFWFESRNRHCSDMDVATTPI